MKRLAMLVATIGLPAAAAAQTPPPPPTPPAPPVPVTVQAPRVIVPPAPRPLTPAPPVVTPWVLDEALLGIDMSAARVAMQGAREALDYALQSDGSYGSCVSYIHQRKYEEAIARCDRVIAQKGSRADAALYWKAYAQYKLRRNDDALATIAQLRRDQPQSRYLGDAKVLENDVRRVDPSTLPDDDLKLLAIQAMQHAEPDRAIPLLEGVLNATNSLQVKRRALYVLAQSTQPRAHQILLNYAKGQGNPDLQLEAIRYIRTNKDRQTTANELRQIYESTSDLTVRRAVIDAYTQTWNAPALMNIVSTADAPMMLRQQAVGGLTNVAAPAELWALYTKEADKDLRMHMVGAFGSMQALDQLLQIVKTEKDPAVRARAIRALGSIRSEKTGPMLVDLYGANQDTETRKAVISALSSQNNAEGLVGIARKEANLELKRAIVERLSAMAPRSKVAADYLMEIIR